MENKNFFDQLIQSSLMTKLVLATVILIWTIVFALLIAGTTLVLERPSGALPPTTIASVPAISLNPTAASAGSTVTVYGDGWPAGSTVLIYLVGPELPSYAISSALVDPSGQFTTEFIFPSDPRWVGQGTIQILAQAEEGSLSAQAFLTVVSLPEQSTATFTPSPTPASATETPTVVVQAPTPTTLPAPAQLTANANLNVRSGPGTNYPIMAVLQNGQTAEVTGRNYDSGWWQIRVAGEYGWVSAQYVTAQNIANVPLVQAPTAPTTVASTATPQPAPTATPVVIYDWRGEYYSNTNLSGAPVVVRSDGSVSFNWGGGAPASNVPADNFSARWTRSLYFDGGTYRVHLRMDDGARLWVDDRLALDAWSDGSAREVAAEYYLSRGNHNLRVEYYERSGEANIALWWEKVTNQDDDDDEDYDDWKGEYYSDRGLDDRDFTRNDEEIDFDWGDEAPGDLPHDDFSVRWSREYDFDDGRYRFQARADDGIRVYLDGKRIIDEWHGGNGDELYTVERNLAGDHELVVEYYEDEGQADVNFSWRRIGDRTTPTPTATPTSTPTTVPTDEPTATPTSMPTTEPTEEPTATPTSMPTTEPTEEPTATPTSTPTEEPTPTPEPTTTPTDTPTATPEPPTPEPPTPTPEPPTPTPEPPTPTPEPPTPTPEPPTPTPEPPTATPTDPASAAEAALNAAIADLSGRIDRPAKRIEVVSVQPVTWNNTTLGCAPDSAHSEPAPVPGYLVILATPKEQFEYHTNQNDSRAKLC